MGWGKPAGLLAWERVVLGSSLWELLSLPEFQAQWDSVQGQH